MLITLNHPSGRSDYGPNVDITEPWYWLAQPGGNYNYLKSPEGVFRRSVNYWKDSPYGWRRVLPSHLDNWGEEI